jgi:hypothetical protein
MVQEHWQKPSARLVVVRAPAPAMNPHWWTAERIEKLRVQDEQAYRTDVLGEFADPESSLFSSAELDRVTRTGPLVLEREPRHEYSAAMDPGTRGNAWTLAIATCRMVGTREVLTVALAKQWQGSKLDPLNPDTVLKEIAVLCLSYGLDAVTTDQYSADALRAIGDRHKLYLYIETITAPRKTELYESLRARIADGGVELPPDPQVRSDLLSVRKRVTTNGISIELPRTADGRHADYAPAIALLIEKHLSPPATAPALDSRGEPHCRAEEQSVRILRIRTTATAATAPHDEAILMSTAALLQTIEELGQDERRVLLALARRLLFGQKAYGRLDLANDRRDWRKERSLEIQDLLVYSAFEELKAEMSEGS